jgi:tetratricopeptide (TPR) repeat protein
MNTLEIEQDNLRAALSWSLRDATDPTTGVRLAAALWPFWSGRGDLREGRAWLHRALRHEHFTDAPPATRAVLLNGAGVLAMAQDDATEAKELIEQGLQLYRDLDDTEGIAASLVNLGSVAWLGERSDIPIAAIIAEAVDLKPQLKDQSTLAMVLTLEGGMALAAGQPDKMAQLNLESLSLFRRLDDARGTAMTLMNVGLARLAGGEIDEAETRLREALVVSHGISHNLFMQYLIIGLAGVAVARGRPGRATRLWAAADALGERYGTKFTPAGRTMIKYDESVAAVRSQLGPLAWDRERAAGDAMSVDEAVAFAMAETPMTTEVFEPQTTEPLSVREVDILRLLPRASLAPASQTDCS